MHLFFVKHSCRRILGYKQTKCWLEIENITNSILEQCRWKWPWLHSTMDENTCSHMTRFYIYVLYVHDIQTPPVLWYVHGHKETRMTKVQCQIINISTTSLITDDSSRPAHRVKHKPSYLYILLFQSFTKTIQKIT